MAVMFATADATRAIAASLGMHTFRDRAWDSWQESDDNDAAASRPMFPGIRSEKATAHAAWLREEPGRENAGAESAAS